MHLIAGRAARAALVGLVAVGGLLVAVPAGAAPVAPIFNQAIDPYADYDGADTCDPTDKPGVKVNWQWSAAVYTQFSTDPAALMAKPSDTASTQSTFYSNSDHAGTPEAFKRSVVGGARGGGGSNYTGSYSSTGSVTPEVATPGPARPDLVEAGVRVLPTPGAARPDPAVVSRALANLGLTRLMIEGGGTVAAAFLRAGLVTHIEWFRAPMILGGEGRPAIAELGLDHLADAPRFKRVEVSSVGEDLWERYEAR